MAGAEKKELAKMLYLHESSTQKEIAARVGVAEVTVSRWATKDNWAGLKASMTITRETQLANLYRQLANLNEDIGSRMEGGRYPTVSEADVISKLGNAIKAMESDIGVAEVISVAKSFIDWARRNRIGDIQERTRLFDAFIADKLR